ncbi:MAG: Gfo/Idh/MocA family oxidoreductase [Verrucomicrobiota bacterium]
MRVGIVGCGMISSHYAENLKGNLSGAADLVACSDLNLELARNLANEFGVGKACSTEELLEDPEIEIAINLTPAPLHFKVSNQILDAGKHLFTEKPLSLSMAEAKKLLEKAKARGLQVAGAADTFLGGGLQLCRRMVETGRIGDVVGAHAIVTVPMKNNRRYQEVFRGVVLDLTPYYIGALAFLFGPVKRVVGLAPLKYPQKVDSDSGDAFAVDLPSTASAVLEFDGGLTATMLCSHDTHGYYPSIELLGTEGRLKLNDANFYTGTVELRDGEGTTKIEPSDADGYVQSKRGLGVAEMAWALRRGKTPRSSGNYMLHVLEVQLAIYRAAEIGAKVEISSGLEKPSLWEEGELDELRS